MLFFAVHWRGGFCCAGGRASAPLYQNIRPVTPEAYFYRTDEHLDINTASAAELELIDGIGPVKAQRIIEYRAAHGPFASVEELALINGISDETVQAAKEVAVALPPKPGVQKGACARYGRKKYGGNVYQPRAKLACV